METLEPAAPSNGRGKWMWGIVGGLAIVGLIAAGIVVIPRLLNTGAGAVNVTAAAMPADTQIYFAFNPHFDKLPNGGVILKAWSDPDFVASLEGHVRDALENAGLDWDQDIASWLGDEAAIGVGDLKLGEMVSSATPAAPSYVMAVATRDKALSDALLDKLRAQADPRAEFRAELYRDVATVERSGDARGAPVAYATVRDLVLVASGPDTLHAAIDAVLDGTGLDKSSKYQSTLGKLRGGRALTAYVDIAPLFDSIMDMMQRSGGLPPAGFDQSALDAIEAVQGVAMGLSFEPDGLLLEMIGVTDVNQLPVESLGALSAPGSPNRLLRAVPDSTFVYLGGDVAPDAFDALRENPQFEESARMIERELGIDLMEDVFSWLNGEIALVAMPGALTGGASSIPFGVALLVDSDDAASAEAGLDRLVRAIADQSFSEIEDVSIGDARLRALVDFSGEPTLVYGLLNDKAVVAFPENAAQKLSAAADNPLAEDDTFREAIAPLPRDNGGYFYVNPKRIIDLVALGMAFGGEECTACALFEPVRAVALAAEQPQAEAGVQRTLMFVLLDVSQ
jgi:hypothetical protein